MIKKIQIYGERCSGTNYLEELLLLHLFSFLTPILQGKKIRKNVKSIVGISPTMV